MVTAKRLLSLWSLLLIVCVATVPLVGVVADVDFVLLRIPRLVVVGVNAPNHHLLERK